MYQLDKWIWRYYSVFFLFVVVWSMEVVHLLTVVCCFNWLICSWLHNLRDVLCWHFQYLIFFELWCKTIWIFLHMIMWRCCTFKWYHEGNRDDETIKSFTGLLKELYYSHHDVIYDVFMMSASRMRRRIRPLVCRSVICWRNIEVNVITSNELLKSWSMIYWSWL